MTFTEWFYTLAGSILERLVQVGGASRAMSPSQVQAALAKLKAKQAAITAKYEALALQAALEAAKPGPQWTKPADSPVSGQGKPKPSKPLVNRPVESHALVGGRNKFGPKGTPSESDLAGCLEDLGNLATAARASGFDVTPLPDGRLTIAAVREWMGRIYDRAQNGDRIFLGFASHGTLVFEPRDPNGETNAVCMDIYDRPGDAGFRSGLFTSWEFADWAVSLPGEIELGAYGDCCHLLPRPSSLVELERPRALVSAPAPYRRPRWIQAPASLRPTGTRARAGQASTTILDSLNIVGVMTCQTNQTASDARIGGRPCGAGTNYIIDAIRRMPGASVEAIVRAAGDKLAANRYEQDPGAFGSATHLARPFMLWRAA